MNCERYKVWMTDAAADGLSARRRADFEAHVRVCVACREEFARVRALVEAIDHGIMAQAAPEPSPEFLGRVRRKIAAEVSPSIGSWARWAPAACAAAIIVAAAIWMMWLTGSKPRQVVKTSSTSRSLVAANHSVANANAAGVKTIPANRTRADLLVQQREARKPRPIGRKPEAPQVIVPPGQAKALMQLFAALRSGKIDGAKLLSEQQEAEQPIKIKPLVIPLLDNTAQAQDKSSGSDGQGTRRDFVGEESAQGLLP